MKKFSNIKLNEGSSELKSGVDLTLRSAVSKLVRDFLHIRTYGPIDPILQGTMRIEGQEEFISAIINLFSDKDVVDTLDILQEAKFNGIDNMIDELEVKINEGQSKSESDKHDKRISDILRNADGNLEVAKKLANQQANKIKSGEKAFYRGISAERMGNSKILKEVSEIFLHRSKKLGYRK